MLHSVTVLVAVPLASSTTGLLAVSLLEGQTPLLNLLGRGCSSSLSTGHNSLPSICIYNYMYIGLKWIKVIHTSFY